MHWVRVVILLALAFTAENQLQNNNFGPYNIVWEYFKTCRGPKSTDCGNITILNTEEPAKNMSDVIFILDFKKDCPMTKARVTIGNNQRNSTKRFLNYSLDSPCQHFVLGPILVNAFNLTAENCRVNKGYYEVHVNMQDTCANFLGSNFFYGRYKFKIYGHNRANNFFCVDTQLLIEKRV